MFQTLCWFPRTVWRSPRLAVANRSCRARWRGCLSRFPPDPGGVAPPVVLGLTAASGRQQVHRVLFWGLDDCFLSTFDLRCPPHRGLVPSKWLLGRYSQPETV